MHRHASPPVAAPPPPDPWYLDQLYMVGLPAPLRWTARAILRFLHRDTRRKIHICRAADVPGPVQLPSAVRSHRLGGGALLDSVSYFGDSEAPEEAGGGGSGGPVARRRWQQDARSGGKQQVQQAAAGLGLGGGVGVRGGRGNSGLWLLRSSMVVVVLVVYLVLLQRLLQHRPGGGGSSGMAGGALLMGLLGQAAQAAAE